ncbi:hypothetical protein GQ568_02685 [Patescibacteria group bacterium]|nr:hypothetical protein [Patescibacteria group bacterium]
MNKKIVIALVPVLFVVIVCGADFAFQKNGQSEEDGKSLLEEFSNGGLKNMQINNDDRPEDLKNYSSQTVLVDEIVSDNKSNKKQKFSITQSLNLFAKIGKDLFGIRRENVFQPVNKIVEFRESIKVPKIIKVPGDYKSIQLAIDNAKIGDSVEVDAGEYKENIIMKEGVNLIGSNVFKKKELEEKEPSSEASDLGSFSSLGRMIVNETILDGGNFGNVVTFKNGITNKTEFAGFTVKNSGKSLSGIFIESSSPWIYDNILIDNEYNIYIKGESSPVIQKNIIQFANKGIQVYNFEKQDSESSEDSESDLPAIVDNLITDNKIGIDLYNSSALIEHNTISYNNHYKTYLGATYGINLSDSSAQIINNIVTDSGICDLCAGINIDEKSKDVIMSYNNIWNNKNNFVCFGECVMEDNNFSEDPLFIDYINGDYKLSEESGLIGKAEDGSDIGVRWN